MPFNGRRTIRILIGASLATLGCLAQSFPAHRTQTSTRERRTEPVIRAVRSCPSGKAIPGEVLVRFVDGLQGSEVEAIVNKLFDGRRPSALRRISETFNLYLIRSWHISADSLREKFKASELRNYVVNAENNLVICMNMYHGRADDCVGTPGRNDPCFDRQWALFDYTAEVPGISAVSAWSLTQGSKKIVVGIIDTGIDSTHLDLKPNLWEAPANFMINFQTWPASCRGAPGWDAIKHTCNPQDTGGHGTHVAGIIGAKGGNTIGLVGVNWEVTLMALRAFNFYGWGSVASVIEAIDFAIQAKRRNGVNVRVLNNSYGERCRVDKPCYSSALEQEIKLANQNDILFVASAGENESQPNNDANPHYPSSYQVDNVIAVAWTNRKDELSPSSNYGLKSVDLGAPGSEIWSTFPLHFGAKGGYNYSNGTSTSTPFVSGTAALVLARCPSLTTTKLKELLLATTDRIDSLNGKTVSGGRLNAFKAVEQCRDFQPKGTQDGN